MCCCKLIASDLKNNIVLTASLFIEGLQSNSKILLALLRHRELATRRVYTISISTSSPIGLEVLEHSNCDSSFISSSPIHTSLPSQESIAFAESTISISEDSTTNFEPMGGKCGRLFNLDLI